MRSVLLTYALPAIVAIGVVIYLFHLESSMSRKAWLENQPRLLQLANRTISDDLLHVAEDLLYLSESVTVSDYLKRESVSSKKVIHDFTQYLLQKEHFEQLRLLSSEGMELVRLNYADGHPKVIAESDLLNQSNHPYFSEPMAMPDGHIFISRFDLNMELGQVEAPPRPMLRFSAPVLDDGEVIGVVVLSYMAQKLIDKLDSLSEALTGNIWLVSQQGYLLNNGSDIPPWGFQFEDMRDATLAQGNPELWAMITAKENGVFESNSNAYGYTQMSIDEASTAHRFDAKKLHFSNDTPWFLVTEYSLQEIQPYLYSAQLSQLTPLLLPVVTGLLLFYLARRGTRAEKELKSNERYLQAVTDNLHEGLLVIGDDGLVRDFNQSTLELFGYTKKQLIGMHLERLIPEDKRKPHRERFERIAGGTEEDLDSVHMRVHGLSCSGDEIPIRISISTIDLRREKLFVCIIADVGRELAYEEQLKQMARLDPLTQLPNRRALYEQADIVFKQGLRMAKPVSLILIDLDDFKRLNDSYGHHFGDDALRRLSVTLKKVVRESDFISRIGGEEFVVLLPDSDQYAAWQLAERLRKAIERTMLHSPDHPVVLSASIGVSEWTGKADDLEGLLGRADKAMYISKREGKNRVTVAK